MARVKKAASSSRAVIPASGLVLPSECHARCLCVGVGSRGQASTSLLALTEPSFYSIVFPPPSFFCVCGICVVAAVKEGHYNPALHLNHGQFYTCCAQLNTSMSTCKTSCCNVLLLKDICILHQCLRPVFALFLCQVANVLEALPFFV